MKNYSLRFKKKIDEVFIIKPNDLGNSFLNFYFKKLASSLKQFPFLYLLPLTVIITFLFFLLFGKKVVFITTLLQYGF